MPIIRRKLQASDVYPDDIRYDSTGGHVQRLVNGSWLDAPESDPRTQTTFPPRITSNPDCDAAQSIADAIKGQIDQILEAIDNAATAFTVAGFILGLFTFGVFEIFIAIALGIANAMLSAGTGALSAALTEAVYQNLVCILLCQMNGSGRLNEGTLATITGQVTDQIGGLGAAILNSMLELAGEGGLNNIAALGTSTGDCSSCDECGCQTLDYDLHVGGVVESANTDNTKTYEITISGTGVVAHDGGGDYTGDAYYFEYPTGANNWTQYATGIGLNSPSGTIPSFAADHVYVFSGLPGTGDPFGFEFVDPSYVENSGHLTIKVCEE